MKCENLKVVPYENGLIYRYRGRIECQRPYHVEHTGSRLITAVIATLGMVSTWMGDRLGTPCAVGFLF